MSHDEIVWSPGPFTLVLSLADGTPRLSRVHLNGQDVVRPATPLPLVELGVVGSGRSWSARRYVDSLAGNRLSYQRHALQADDTELVVTSVDESNGLTVTTTLSAVPGAGALRISSRLVNTGSLDVDLTWITSAIWGGTLADAPFESLRLWWADNDWLAENRWTSATTREVLPDLNWEAHKIDPRGTFARTALGAWSTDGTLPLGVVTDESTGLAVGWQLEHNGGWHWQAGERADGLYVSLLGPTETEHDWYCRLAPGQEFSTVPVTIAFATNGFEGVVAALTAARRYGRRLHPDHTRLPVIFNDYMNTLMGDPTTAKLLPLIDAAAEVGAETFCIDAGWYDDDAQGWWDSVGAWEPAPNRFPGGLSEVLDHIRDRGMVPGLWLEPEMVGVRSPIAESLPDEAFFLRHGRRVVEHGRYHLDLRHPLARKHLDEVIDRLVGGLGVGYLKLDHNINFGVGTDHDAISAGAGLLGHNRALLQWIDGVLDRHPDLTLENCSSGGMRVDYAMLSHLQVQSTTDQQDPLYFPPIAAAAAAAIAPEQAAHWVYPQPTFTDELIAFTMTAGLLGRLHLSGHLDQMTDAQRALVAEAITTYRGYRPFVATAVPFWPLGLPGWEDQWIAHGLRDDQQTLLAIWRRGGDSDSCIVPLPAADVEVLYPKATDATIERVEADGVPAVRITFPHTHQAVVLAVGDRSAQ
ncbi:alpha-galactosidase [Kribbella antibiotica]|uniref:Alpha-galactosidase n=1 Tax=Kribbella antibiotica TaxID=190195 RepID=A0A4R4ZQ59_9ACTN|nr:glycoside hydrolase family 36 protein [Kribbella antibiotica]TDD60855.1 alpha-galactosidase [Kribbella antibiotica]